MIKKDSSDPETNSGVGDSLPSNIDGMQIVKSTYNQIADTYDDIRQRDSADQLLDFVFANVEPHSNVLDVGCGTGRPITLELSKKYNMVAIDNSEKMIEIADENLSDSVELINTDVRSVDFQKNKFQAIVMYYVLVNVPRDEHKHILKSLYEFLHDGGYLLFSAGRGDYKIKVTQNWLNSGNTMVWSFYNNETYIDMLKNIGYEIKAGVIEAPHELKGDKKRNHPFILAKK